MGMVSRSRSPIWSIFLAPVQAFAAWSVPRPRFSCPVTVKTDPIDAGIPAPGRLRIVREFDSTVSPACAGRMVISGRMTDVCAELERMVQCETAAQ